MVLRVVREHGGQVHVLSPPQGGAIFQIELPAAAETAQEEVIGAPQLGPKNFVPEAGEAASGESRFAPGFETGKGARVLEVEDEPTEARLIADVLEDEGKSMEGVMTGREQR